MKTHKTKPSDKGADTTEVKRPVGRQMLGTERRVSASISATESSLAAAREHFGTPGKALELAVKYFKEIKELEKKEAKEGSK